MPIARRREGVGSAYVETASLRPHQRDACTGAPAVAPIRNGGVWFVQVDTRCAVFPLGSPSRPPRHPHCARERSRLLSRRPGPLSSLPCGSQQNVAPRRTAARGGGLHEPMHAPHAARCTRYAGALTRSETGAGGVPPRMRTPAPAHAGFEPLVNILLGYVVRFPRWRLGFCADRGARFGGSRGYFGPFTPRVCST